MFATFRRISCEQDRTADRLANAPQSLGLSTYANLLSLAVWASLHDSHQMGMLALFLGLGSSTSGSSHVDSILSHDRETRQSDLGVLLGLFPWLLCNTSSVLCWRSHGERAISGITEIGRRGARRSGEDWRESRGLRGWALLKGRS